MSTFQARLWLLRNRNNLYFFIVSISILTTMLLAFLTIIRIQKQSERNEQILKGLSCILLILPEQRTKVVVQECVDKNSLPNSNNGDNTKFQFNTSQTSTSSQTTTNNSMAMKSQALPIPPITKPIQKTDLPREVTTSQPLNPTVVAEIPISRPIEVRVNPVTLEVETRLAGDEFWQVK